MSCIKGVLRQFSDAIVLVLNIRFVVPIDRLMRSVFIGFSSWFLVQ